MMDTLNPLESSSDNELASSVEAFFDNEATTEPEVKEEVPASEEIEAPVEEAEEEVTDSEEGGDVTEEDIDEEDSGEESESESKEEHTDIKESELAKDLRGVFSKEHIALLESVDDLDLRNDLIEVGKRDRADVDRKRQELGESKKLMEILDEGVKTNGLSYNKQQYAGLIKNFIGFDALFSKDPKLAIERLAESAKIDINTLGKSAVHETHDDDYDDYRSPEEIKTSQEIQTLKQELDLIKNQKQQEQQISVEQELHNFATATDTKGDLKYPHFERVKQNMALFFTDVNPDMTMEKAYKRAVLLDDDLVSQRDAKLLKSAEIKRKNDIAKAKKLKRQSVRSSKVSAHTSNPDAALEKLVGDFFG